MIGKKRAKERRKIPLRNIILILALCCMSIFISFTILKFKASKKIESTSKVIVNKLESLSEISSLKYNYTSVIGIKENITLDKFKIPFTEKSFLVQYNGYIKFGTNLSTAKIELDKKAENVVITLENSRVLDNVVDLNNLQVYDEKWTVFNKLSSQEVIDEIARDQKNKADELVDSGYVKEANDRVSTLLKELFLGMEFKNVEVKFSS